MLNVGGIYLTDVNSNTAGGPQAVSVPKELQRASLKWVLGQIKDSAWLEQPALTEKLPLHVDLSFILRFNFCRAFFTYYKNVILSSHIADDPYTPQEYMDDLYGIVFESTIKGRPVSPSERLIQRMFVDAAADVASSEAKRMKLGGIAEAYAPSVDEIALMGLDRSGVVGVTSARCARPKKSTERDMSPRCSGTATPCRQATAGSTTSSCGRSTNHARCSSTSTTGS